jgi:hypothetical protein
MKMSRKIEINCGNYTATRPEPESDPPTRREINSGTNAAINCETKEISESEMLKTFNEAAEKAIKYHKDAIRNLREYKKFYREYERNKKVDKCSP